MMGLRRMWARTKTWVCSRLAPGWVGEKTTKCHTRKQLRAYVPTPHSCVLNIIRTKYNSRGPGCQILWSHDKTESCRLSACSSGCIGLPPSVSLSLHLHLSSLKHKKITVWGGAGVAQSHWNIYEICGISSLCRCERRGYRTATFVLLAPAASGVALRAKCL